MPKLRTAFRIIALALLLFAVIVSVPLLARLSTGDNGNAIDTRDGAASIYFVSNRQLVPIDTGCIDVEWRVEGIRTVQVNGLPAIGEGTQTVCAESPRLTVTMQDGGIREYRLPRQVAFTTPYRVLIVVSIALLLVAFIPWRTPRFARLFVSRLRAWLGAEQRPVLIAVLLLTLLAAGLRLLYLNGSMRQDEVVTFRDYAGKSTWDAISLYYSTNNHVLHTLLMNLAYGLFGNQPWVLRLPVFFAGVLLVPASYAAGRAVYSSSAGLLAAALVASSSLLTVFATFGRGYMLQCLLAVVLLGLAAYVLRFKDRFGWCLYALAAALGFYTSATMIYPFAIISLWLGGSLLLLAPRGQRLRALLPFVVANVGAALAALLLHAPVFLVSGLSAFFANEYVVPLSVAEFAALLPDRLTSAWNASMLDIPTLVVVALVAGFVASILFSPRLSRFRLPLGLCALLIVPPIMFVLRVPIYQRVMLPLLPLFFIVACGGLAGLLRLGQRVAAPGSILLGAGIAAIVVSSGSVHAAIHYDMGAFPDAAVAITDLAPQLEPGDIVIAHRRSTVVKYYFQLYDIGEEYAVVPNEPSSARRVFIFTPYPSQPPDKILDDYGFDPQDFSAPELLRHYGGYALYLVHGASLAVQST